MQRVNAFSEAMPVLTEKANALSWFFIHGISIRQIIVFLLPGMLTDFVTRSTRSASFLNRLRQFVCLSLNSLLNRTSSAIFSSIL
jgi:hypothetical protein